MYRFIELSKNFIYSLIYVYFYYISTATNTTLYSTYG